MIATLFPVAIVTAWVQKVYWDCATFRVNYRSSHLEQHCLSGSSIQYPEGSVAATVHMVSIR